MHGGGVAVRSSNDPDFGGLADDGNADRLVPALIRDVFFGGTANRFLGVHAERHRSARAESALE